MDSPPECVLALSCEQPQSPPILPSLDHSPQASSPHTQLSLPNSPLVLPLHSPDPSPHSLDCTPFFPLSPFPLHQDSNHHIPDDEDEEEGLDGVPPSPTPAVALFPGGGGQEAGCSPGMESSPPAMPLAPLTGFGALELALSSGQGGNCNDELDLQLFQKDSVTGVIPGVGGASSGPALRFPCHVCGKRFRFQSILSLHARAHSLDRDRRATALYRTSLPPASLQQHLNFYQNHKDVIQNHHSHPQNQRPLPTSLIQNLREEDGEDQGQDEGLQTEENQKFMLDESTPLTPPLTEDPVSLTSPYSSGGPTVGEATPATATPVFRCHACKGKFRTASELARHVRILHNPYKCTLCPFSASQEERLASHLQECHPAPEVSSLPPAYTPRPIIATPDTPVPTPAPTPTPTTPQMGATTAVATLPSLPAFRCEVCGQRFTQSWFLKGHMRKHKDSLDHKCQVCGRGFKEPWFLKNHMKVHLNKLGLKAGLGVLGLPAGADQQAKGSASSQSLNALYSSLLLAQRGGGGGRGGRGRSERDIGGRGGIGSSKSAILGYLGLPSDGGGASCMERLQAVAQVAEMGNGGGSGLGGGEPGRGGGGSRGGGGEMTASVSDGGDQVAMWQLVARSLVAAQQAQQQQRSQPRGQQQSQRGPARSSIIGDADQVRAYLAGLDPREEAAVSGSAGGGGPWECPDCGKLFRSLQQVVVHARVHTQRPQKGGREEEGSGSLRGGGGRGGGSEVRQELKLLSSGTQHQTAAAAAGFPSVISTFQGENGLSAVSSLPSGSTRERVRGTGVKDCPYCGKAFRSSHHLKVHLRVHTGERPYKCPHCDYAGTQSGSLKYHLQRHHREQRNALSASSSNSSSTSFTSSINTLAPGAPSRGEGLVKQRQSQVLTHSLATRGPTDTPSSRHSQQPWLLGLPDQREHQKALAALRDVDLETQYRYLSGVMGALYQGGMEGGWIRESPPPKPPKVSRRKPLTTNRMVQPSNGSTKDGSVRSTQEGGFEPLDLSRRPSPGLGGLEEDGVTSGGEGGGGGGDRVAGVTLSQCLFCPFRTSSGELMSMHLQVNHTSKSRRKRSSSAALDDDGPPKPPQPQADCSDPDPLARWRHVSEAEDQARLEAWASIRAQTHNGLSEDGGGQPENSFNHQASDLASASRNLRAGLVLEGMVEEDDDEQEEEEEEEELEAAGENSSLGDSPREEQDLRMPLSLSPALGSNDHMRREEDGVVTD